MKNFIIKSFYLLILTVSQFAVAKSFPMDELYKVADGLNIEGGDVCRKYLNEQQTWANICVILDRPFHDGIEWQALTNANSFPLKEASISDYNDAQVNYCYASIMGYYIKHCHEIAKKSKDECVKILMQVHRNTSGPSHVALLESLLTECFPDFSLVKSLHPTSKYEISFYFLPDLNVEIVFCYGVLAENLGEENKYSDVDIVLSFSLVAGFHQEWKSGSFLLPDYFIPFPLSSVKVEMQNCYRIKNHLKTILSSLIADQDLFVLNVINSKFLSMNQNKQDLTATFLQQEDFKEATILQADRLFNPSQLPKFFSLN